MQWILQKFEDTERLAKTLDALAIPYSWHNVVPFVGDLVPEAEIDNPKNVVLFGAYALWRYSEKHQFYPGIIKIEPFIYQNVWQPYLLNGNDSLFFTLQDIPDQLKNDDTKWFFRPVDDTKAQAGKVRMATEIISIAENVLKLNVTDIPDDSLRHDTKLILSKPETILQEWRIWVIAGEVVTYSLYREKNEVIYKLEIDKDALIFAKHMASLHPDYATAYVIDICRTKNGLKLLETNCINAAGFYAADLEKLVKAIEKLS